MIHILLLCLKIIGITLLSLLGLLVLIVLVILFVPIRYSLNAEVDESVKVRARVSWLLHLLHAEAVYNDTFGVVIRLFGIPVKRIPEPEEPASRKKKEKPKNKKRSRGAGEELAPDTDDMEAGEKSSAIENEAAEPETENDGISQAHAEKTAAFSNREPTGGQEGGEGGAEPSADSTEPEKLSFFQKIAQFFRKTACFFRAVRAFFSKILYTIRNICGKIEKIKELISYYLDVLKSEEGQRTFALVKRELGRLFRHIAPTKLKGSLTIGMDDPAATGQTIAILSMFYPIYGNNVSITPDFDEKCMRGSLYLKGRVRIITLIRIAWRVYFNKDMKKFLHMLKREENEA